MHPTVFTVPQATQPSNCGHHPPPHPLASAETFHPTKATIHVPITHKGATRLTFVRSQVGYGPVTWRGISLLDLCEAPHEVYERVKGWENSKSAYSSVKS